MSMSTPPRLAIRLMADRLAAAASDATALRLTHGRLSPEYQRAARRRKRRDRALDRLLDAVDWAPPQIAPVDPCSCHAYVGTHHRQRYCAS